MPTLTRRLLGPRKADIPRARRAIRFYSVFAYVTGIMLLLLCVEMVVKYGLGYELELGGRHGFLEFVPWNPVTGVSLVTGVNLSTGVLIAHGWLYVVYLVAVFQLWSIMRWPFLRFVLLALGGVVPFLSFIVEHFAARIARREVQETAERHAREAEDGAAGASASGAAVGPSAASGAAAPPSGPAVGPSPTAGPSPASGRP